MPRCAATRLDGSYCTSWGHARGWGLRGPPRHSQASRAGSDAGSPFSKGSSMRAEGPFCAERKEASKPRATRTCTHRCNQQESKIGCYSKSNAPRNNSCHQQSLSLLLSPNVVPVRGNALSPPYLPLLSSPTSTHIPLLNDAHIPSAV